MPELDLDDSRHPGFNERPAGSLRPTKSDKPSSYQAQPISQTRHASTNEAPPIALSSDQPAEVVARQEPQTAEELEPVESLAECAAKFQELLKSSALKPLEVKCTGPQKQYILCEQHGGYYGMLLVLRPSVGNPRVRVKASEEPEVVRRLRSCGYMAVVKYGADVAYDALMQFMQVDPT